MKKIIYNLFLITITLLLSLIVVLSTIGIETNKFNKLITRKASEIKNINLDLDTIKFKINPKELSLFLETSNPKITYREIIVPVKNIKAYIDFLSLLNSDPIIKKTSILLEELDIKELNKLAKMIKPSNFRSLLNNKIEGGKLISEVEFYFSDSGTIKNFIAKGTVKDLKINLFSDLIFSKVSLGFFADKNDILIKNIFGNLEEVKISEGDIKLNIENGIKLESNFNSKLNFDESLINKYDKFFNNYQFTNIKNFHANLNNSIFIVLDNTYKIKDYSYRISGALEKGKFELLNPIKNNLIAEEIKEIYLSDFKISSNFRPNKIKWSGEGKYSLNNQDYFKVILENNFNKNLTNLDLNFDYGYPLEIDLINYKKANNSISNLSLNLEKTKNKIKINELTYKHEKNLIKIDSLILHENSLASFKRIDVMTSNNDFSIQSGKKIFIRGKKFDATNLAKFFKTKKGENRFKKISNKIEVDFKNIQVPMSEKLENFKLLGEIKNGQFIKISSKGDFGGNNFLDISMKKDKGSDKKYLEIYSDLPRPLLSEYSFFNGLAGGKLLFTSIIEESKSYSKLKIENFKIINAPGVIKLLSIADLGGLADLAEGDGLSFDFLEIEMEKSGQFLKLNEILALGPSISVLMEGYQDENGITSLKGTLVPAKTLNRVISKIPVIGNIVIPKEAGEGLFGISFKMKGPKGKIKTSINPIKTITPRFIQKIIEKNKEAK